MQTNRYVIWKFGSYELIGRFRETEEDEHVLDKMMKHIFSC